MSPGLSYLSMAGWRRYREGVEVFDQGPISRTVWPQLSQLSTAFYGQVNSPLLSRLLCTYCLVSDRRSTALNWEGVVPSHVRKAR
jgi:hypothetical protein